MQATRRAFLTASAGLAAMGALCPAALAEEAQAQWDGEYDVVVLGSGFAGMAAAVEAADNGASVLLSEKAPEGSHGGNSRVSGQYIMSTDDTEAMYTYLNALVSPFPNYDDAVLRTMVQGCYDNFDWLVNTLGADPYLIMPSESWEGPYSFTQPVEVSVFDNRTGYIQNWCEYKELPCGEHALSILVNGTCFDASYFNLLQENVQKRDGIEVWYEAPGKRLIRDETGRVVGVKILKDGKVLRIHARGGVILATGGFENNKEMLANYLQKNNIYCRGAVYNEGDGITMAQEVGAELWHMSNAAGYNLAYQPEGANTCITFSTSGEVAQKGIFVGSNGKRFMFETAKNRHGRIDIGGTWMMTPVPNPMYIILDNSTVGTTKLLSSFSENNEEEIASGVIVSGETIEELGEKLGMDADAIDSFVNTVNRYNTAYDNGEQADYDRPWDTITPLANPPFYALKLVATMYNTQGGPRRNEYAQVVDVDLNAIPGLFSAGELGALWPDMYNGGGNISEATIFGRIAGKNAALDARGEFEGAPYVDPDSILAEQASQQVPTENTEANADDSDVSSIEYVDGDYSGEGTGFGGAISLTVTIENGQIADIQYTASETAGIGEAALPLLVEDAKNGVTQWDGPVSGASLTTAGFEEALTKALAQASKN